MWMANMDRSAARTRIGKGERGTMGWLTGNSGAARTVGMGEIAVARTKERLQCIGLGSCLAVIAYDRASGKTGIAHAVLPRPLDPAETPAPAKYASLSIRALASAIVEEGGDLSDVRVALVGGAQLLPGASSRGMALPQLGERNVEEVRLQIRAFGFALVAEDVGGSVGRTVTLDGDTGAVTVRTTLGGSHTLCELRDEAHGDGGMLCAA